MNEVVGELSTRLEKLEEERDFYRALLDAPERKGGALPPGDDPPQP